MRARPIFFDLEAAMRIDAELGVAELANQLGSETLMRYAGGLANNVTRGVLPNFK